jgi:PAS domain S-box-containing protein
MKLRLRNSIRTRLLLLALLVAIPAFLMLVIGSWFDLRRVIDTRKLDAEQITLRAQGKFDTLLETSRTIFTDLVQVSGMRNPNNCALIFNDLQLAFERLTPEATNLSLSDSDGNIYCAVNPVKGTRNIKDHAFFLQAIESLDMSISEYAFDPSSNEPTFKISYPVYSFDGNVQTIIFITYNLNWLDNWQREVALPSGSSLTLFNNEGIILQRYEDNSITPWTPGMKESEWFVAHVNKGSEIEDNDIDGINRLNFIVPLELGPKISGWLHLGYPISVIYTQAYEALFVRLALLAVIFFIALAIGYWGSQNFFLHPLNDLMKVVQKIQHGDLTARASSIPAVTELSSLALSFDRMAQSLQERESARLEAKAELQKADARFRTMFENSPVGMGLMGLDRKIIDSNPAMCNMLGYTLEELVGNTPAIATHPDDYEVSTANYQDLILGKIDQFIQDRRYIRKNGEIFWVQVSISMVRDSDRNPLYMVGVITDIDKQKKSGENLRESEARFRAMFENSGIGIALVSTDRRPLAVNDSLVTISGRTREELLSTTGAMISHPDDVNIGSQELRNLIAGSLDSFQVERRYIRKENRPYWVKQTISAVRNPDGQIMYLVVMVEDIDAQKKDQENLRTSEARFQAMFANTSVGMALMSLDRHVLKINQAALDIVGRTREEIFNMDPSQLSHPDDVEIGKQEFGEMLEGKKAGFMMEKRYIRSDKKEIWARVTYSAVPDKNGLPQYLIGIIEDFTDKKYNEEKLAKQEADYRRTLEQRVEQRTIDLKKANSLLVNEIDQRLKAEKALAEKAAEEAVTNERTRLARDLHDAVTQTLFSASLIAEVLPELWESNIEVAQQSTEELRQLTRGALAEMRTLLLELRPAALTQSKFGDLLRQLCEALIGRGRLPIELLIEGDTILPPDVQVALYRISQESLNNVFKYARASKINVNLDQSQNYVKLEVHDNGVGFDPGHIKPSSLGMRIMQERAESIGADLKVSSSPGEGTSITVTWKKY